ncbi:MAG: hypothetical protein SVX38_06225 [Chloroflexota bacterium]|nr:hypothetical protein [Chloroflexota bacterium]
MFRTFDRYFDLRPLERRIGWLSATWWLYLVLGLFLILTGVAIVIWPPLLAVIVAAFLITVGMIVIFTGWQIRRERNRYRRYKRDILGF